MATPMKAVIRRFDPKKRMWQADNGTVLTLRPVSSAALYALDNPALRPTPPIKEVTIAGGSKMEIEDETNPDYLRQLAMYLIEQDFRARFMLFTQGVANTPPKDFYEYAAVLGFTKDYDVKFQWVSSLVPTAESAESLVHSIASLSMPTTEGISQAEDMFPGKISQGNGAMGGFAVSNDGEAEAPRGEAIDPQSTLGASSGGAV